MILKTGIKIDKIGDLNKLIKVGIIPVYITISILDSSPSDK